MSTHKHKPTNTESYQERYPIYEYCECGATRKRFILEDPWHICTRCVNEPWRSVLFPTPPSPQVHI